MLATKAAWHRPAKTFLTGSPDSLRLLASLVAVAFATAISKWFVSSLVIVSVHLINLFLLILIDGSVQCRCKINGHGRYLHHYAKGKAW